MIEKILTSHTVRDVRSGGIVDIVIDARLARAFGGGY